MSGVIKLLNDAVANQIAAGEVVQRPASAVKELLENSIDAGAKKIKLLIKDGGSSLIQVIDDGKGMNEIDARMCWERHATSKINTAHDLFSLDTYGFRGEALASIAAVAQVEMTTRQADNDIASFIRIEGSEVIEQTEIQAPKGTKISIKNLFFNIPARRNFLKSIPVETKHIYEEFYRQALANPSIEFQLFNNGQEIHHYTKRNFSERIIDIISPKKRNTFIEFEENTDIVKIHGFAGTPEISRKTRGEQYFFVNGRFIKSPYLNHAISNVYEGLIEKDNFPTFVINMNVDPSKIDVNVHPTKTEVKFEDEKYIYQILKVAIKRALSEHFIPKESDISGVENFKDFLNNDVIDWSQFKNESPNSSESKNYNPFGETRPHRSEKQDWQKILGPIEGLGDDSINQQNVNPSLNQINKESDKPQITQFFPLGNQYLATSFNDQLWIIHIKRALLQIHYHSFLDKIERQTCQSQQLLFPRTIELNSSQVPVILEILDTLKFIGFDLGHFGGNSLIVNGIPPQFSGLDEQKLIETLLNDYESTAGETKLKQNESIAWGMAHQYANQQIQSINSEEQLFILEELFSMSENQITRNGKPIMVKIGTETLFDLFNNRKR
ncbi:MAG: DNA mismatch repair endonuclease MutL [Bacteroidia bacterium]